MNKYEMNRRMVNALFDFLCPLFRDSVPDPEAWADVKLEAITWLCSATALPAECFRITCDLSNNPPSVSSDGFIMVRVEARDNGLGSFGSVLQIPANGEMEEKSCTS